VGVLRKGDAMTAAFAEWQPRYAAKHIPTFPVNDNKKPGVRAWNRVGFNGSAELAEKFHDADAFGFQPGKRSRVTVLDVDTRDEAVLGDAIKQHGGSPFLVMTGNGFHVYYRHGGEPRRIRRDGEPPIDLLGGGYVIAPPSQLAKGGYEIIRGTFDDLDRLPPIKGVDHVPAPIPKGTRDNTVFKLLLRDAQHCDDFETLLDRSMTLNMDCMPPMTDAQVLKIATSVWRIETSGNNLVGRKARASTDRDELLALSHDPAAWYLLMFLRVSHPPIKVEPFAIDQVKVSQILDWSRMTLRSRITTLLQGGYLKRVHYGKGTNDPHLYVLMR
jgi:hypothetical protein